MDMCGLDNDTARRLAGDKVGFFALLYSEYPLSIILEVCC